MTGRAVGARRAEILRAAARLFAARGFHGVSIDDLGKAVGTSGPALYRHFPGKEALLAAMLLEVSERLAADGSRCAESVEDPRSALEALLRGHIRFALTEPALITVHDRELDNVPEPHRRRIRRLQRGYVEQWAGVLVRLRPDAAPATLRASVHAAFGLLNSTPHSADELPAESMTDLLLAMGTAALLAQD